MDGSGGSDLVAAIALGVSGVSAALAIVSLVLGFRESSRRDEEVRLLREESGRRDEELALLREQVAHAREEREREKRARLTVTEGGKESGTSGIVFRLSVTNAGPHFASNVLLRLRAADGQPVGERMHEEPIMPGSPPVTIAVHTPPPDRYSGPYDVEVSWDDGRGRIVGSKALTVARP